MFKANFDESKGEVVSTYLHNKTSANIGKIGSVFVSQLISLILSDFEIQQAS